MSCGVGAAGCTNKTSTFQSPSQVSDLFPLSLGLSTLQKPLGEIMVERRDIVCDHTNVSRCWLMVCALLECRRPLLFEDL